MNIGSEPLDNLVRLGYTPEEAQFIYIVSTHSGYFTHRQFLNFAGIRPGKHSQKFLVKLLAQKHATYHTYPSGGRVYHIFARQVFGAMGRDDLRTRRRHQLDYIKTRLVTLDFVLANLDCEYLETEAEKVPFFESRMNMDPSLLPRKVYLSKASSRTTIRYFVDRYPIFVREPLSPAPGVCFTYIDAGSVTLQGFATHLHAYRALLRSVSKFEFSYIAPSDRFFRGAAEEFSRIVLASKAAVSKEQVLRYFESRRRWEAGERVAAADVVFLNAARAELCVASVEAQYREWTEGTIKESDIIAPPTSYRATVNGTFRTLKCGESLGVFGRSYGVQGESAGDATAVAFSPTVSPEDLQP